MSRVHRPDTIDAALDLLADLEHPLVYGGGTALQILRKQGLLHDEDYIDISRVPGLRDLRSDDSGLHAGTLVPLRRMETDPEVRRLAPLASETYAKVANPRVRNTASIGGNIAHGDYRLDPPTALVVLDAEVHLASREGGPRTVSIREFFTQFQETAVRPDEMITALAVPCQPAGSRGAYCKLSSLSENDWPCASAAALAVPEGDFTEIRLGLGALAATTVYLAFDATPDMDDQAVVDAALDIANSAMDPIEDIRGSAAYKAELGRVAVEEAVRRTLKELTRD